MRVFVLGTGRNGSTTIARAFSHATNFTSAHESRVAMVGPERFDYPDQHVESDNRLSWMLGSLGERFPDALYVHLRRSTESVAASFLNRWDSAHPSLHDPRSIPYRMRGLWTGQGMGLMKAFAYGIVPGPKSDRAATAHFMIDVVDANIEHFVRDKESLELTIESLPVDLPYVWERIGASGDLAAAIAEARVRHNAQQ